MIRATRRFAAALCLGAILLVGACGTSAETIKLKDIEVTVNRDGCGLVDEVSYRGEVVMSARATGHAPTGGFDVGQPRLAAAKQLTAKLKTLEADAPCKMVEHTSARGDKLITLENGLLKVTVLPRLGGRIIRLESKLSGENFLDDPYEDRPDEIKDPKDTGGIWGELADAAFRPQVVKRSDDEIVVKLTGQDEGARIERTLRLGRGRPMLEIEQTQTNTGRAREAVNHLYGRFRIGAGTGDDDVLWGSSRGRLARALKRGGGDPDCFTDPRTDHWAAVCDAKEGPALVGLFAGPVTRIGTWIQPNFYQLEFLTARNFTLAAGKEMTTRVRLAPCFNMGGVAFANQNLAVGIVAESDVVAASAKHWATRITAVSFAGPDRKVTLRASLTNRHGEVVATLPPVTIVCPFLIARPQLVKWPMGDLPGGAYEMRIAFEAEGKKIGQTALRLRRVEAGPICEIFRPADAEAGELFPATGTVERGKVRVISVSKVSPTMIRISGEHVFEQSRSPFAAEIRLNPDGDGFDIKHTLTCNAAGDVRIRAVAVALPLALGSDHFKIRTTIGGDKLNDSWRIDQSDEMISTSIVSDWFSRWPLWKLGGVLQDAPTHYRIWKASDWDVAPMTTLEGSVAPGWVEANNGARGVRIEMPDLAAKAPKAILVDGHAGLALAYFYPPHARPISLAGSGDPAAPSLAQRLNWRRGEPWTNTVSVKFHPGPHTRGFKREISDTAFRAALEALGDPAVPRSMRAVALPGGTYQQCIQNVLDSDLSFRAYLGRAVGMTYGLRGLCAKLGCEYTSDREKTIDGLIKTLKAKYP